MTEIPTGSPESPLTTPDAILRRRSVRHFRDEPVDPEVLERLLRLATAAPSSWNLQPWRLVVIRDTAQRERLSQACYRQPQPREAAVAVVFAISHAGWRDVLEDVVDEARGRGAWSDAYIDMFERVAPAAQDALGERLREYNVKDALIAATHLALAAESVGLGSAFLNGYDEQAVKAVIGAADDDDIGVALVMAIGYPDRRGGDPGRLPLERTVFAESLQHPWREPV